MFKMLKQLTYPLWFYPHEPLTIQATLLFNDLNSLDLIELFFDAFY